MAIDITHFALNTEAQWFSASRAELGDNASQITWANAIHEAALTQFIDAASRGEFEAWIHDFGAWDDDEIKAWPLDECNALLIQYISGELRTLEGCGYDAADEYGIDWAAVTEKLDGGNSIYKGDNGKLYFYMGS